MKTNVPYECDCVMTVTDETRELEFCPLHAAAPQLLAKLEYLYNRFFTDGDPNPAKVALTPAVALYEIKQLIESVK